MSWYYKLIYFYLPESKCRSFWWKVDWCENKMFRCPRVDFKCNDKRVDTGSIQNFSYHINAYKWFRFFIEIYLFIHLDIFIVLWISIRFHLNRFCWMILTYPSSFIFKRQNDFFPKNILLVSTYQRWFIQQLINIICIYFSYKICAIWKRIK